MSTIQVSKQTKYMVECPRCGQSVFDGFEHDTPIKYVVPDSIYNPVDMFTDKDRHYVCCNCKAVCLVNYSNEKKPTDENFRNYQTKMIEIPEGAA